MLETVNITIKIPKILDKIIERFSKASNRDKDTFIVSSLAQEIRAIYELEEEFREYHIEKSFIKIIEKFIDQYFESDKKDIIEENYKIQITYGIWIEQDTMKEIESINKLLKENDILSKICEIKNLIEENKS